MILTALAAGVVASGATFVTLLVKHLRGSPKPPRLLVPVIAAPEQLPPEPDLHPQPEPDPGPKLELTAMPNFIETVEADAKVAIDTVKSGLHHLADEGKTILAWVEKEVPGSAGAIATFLQSAESDAAVLAKIAANGLSAEISAGSDAMQTYLLNLIQSTHLASNAQGAMKSIDVSAVALLNTVGQSLVSTALAQILAKLAAVAVASA